MFDAPDTKMPQQRRPRLCLLAVAILAASTPPLPATEPAGTTIALRDWAFTAWEAGAGEHPITQAGDGSMIIGHAGGLLRFDGHRITPVPMPLGYSAVKQLHRDRSGGLHILLADGTHAVRSDRGTHLVEDADGASPRRGADPLEPMSICEAGDGSVWVGYRQGLVSRTVGLRRQWHPIPDRPSAWPDVTAFVAADTNGRIWLARRTCLAVWSGSDWQVACDLPDQQTIVAPARDGGLWVRVGTRVHHFDGDRLTAAFDADVPTIRGLAEDRDGRLWIATTRYGLVMWDGDRLATAETAGGSVYAVYCDREGSIWAGTTAGLERGEPRLVQRVEMPTLKPLRAIRCDSTDRLWFLTLDGEVGSQSGPLPPWLRSGGRGTDATVFHSRLDGWRYGTVTALTISPRDVIWLGTRDGGIVRLDQQDSIGAENLSTPPDLRGQPVTAMLAIDDGLLVGIGSSVLWNSGDSWHRLDWPAERTAAEVTLMVGDGAGGAWLTTTAGDLYRFRMGAGAEERPAITTQPIPRDAPAAVITSVVPLPDGSVWLATRGGGLWRLRDDRWSMLNSTHGLPSETVLAALPDDRGRLWCAAPRIFFAVQTGQLAQAADGRIDRCHCWIVTRDDRTAYFDPAVMPPDIACSGRDGVIMVTLPTGIAACLTDRLPPESPPPPIWVSGLRIDGRALPQPTPTVHVPADPRVVEVFLGESILPTPTNARIEHRLTGIDQNWIETPPERRLVYDRLPPGRHDLRVRSANGAGTWDEPSPACTLEVAPRWWERPMVRWGAILAVAMATAAVTLFLHSRRTVQHVHRLHQRAALDHERMRIARDMHDDLGTSLTQISLLADLAGRQASPETAAALKHISRIACDTVAAFDEIVWAVNPEHDTLQHLLGYMALSASQTLSSLGIECRFDMPGDVPPRTAPADFRRDVMLIVKEAINNVVKHAAARAVTIGWRVVDERLSISITDDGRGGEPKDLSRARPALGLENMGRRAGELGGECSVMPVATGGTRVILHVPLPRAERAVALRPQRGEEPDATGCVDHRG